jgi:serine phosphatase RsbU (regulator of sigma subunit)
LTNITTQANANEESQNQETTLPTPSLIDQLNDQAWEVYSSDPTTALTLALQAHTLAEQIAYKHGLAYSWRNSSAANWMLSKHHQALSDAQNAVRLLEELDDKRGKSVVLTIFAAIYGTLCEYDAALSYQLKALTLAEEMANKTGIYMALYNIGAIYYAIGDYHSALDYQLKSLALAEEVNSQEWRASSLSIIGYNYLKLNQPEQALEAELKALDLIKELEDPLTISQIYNYAGSVFAGAERHDEALDYLFKSLDLFEQIGNRTGIAKAYGEIGNLYAHIQEYSKALTFFEKSLKIAEETGARDQQFETHLECSKVYESMGDYANALKHHKLYAEIRNAVINSDNQKAVAGMQIRFNVEKAEKEREIYRLRNVEMARVLTEVERANQEIASLNDRLKAENLRMSAELEVTRQLQQMILPKDYELTQIKGLEIAGYMEAANEVGGDYYDVLNEAGRIKIGIGDVTGHGLESGVLMLMVQTAVRTLLIHNESNPQRFLETVNRVIYENVQRMNSEKNLTLSLLDYDNGKLVLTGQHEEPILVRNDGGVERINTMDLGFPIGLELDISAFINHLHLELQPGDVLVLYSDGIPEAENMAGEQYGLDRLCEITQVNHTNNSETIKQTIIDDLMRHIGEQKVFDDITLLVLKQL